MTLFLFGSNSAEEGWLYLKSKGNSFPETMLTIAILFMIMGGLIPLFVEMRILLEDQKRSLHAAETAYQAAIENNRFHIISGMQEKDGVNYFWMREEDGICVSYHSHKNLEKSVCVRK